MVILSQLVTSFIASAGFGVLFNVPLRALVQSGLVGMFGWILYYLLVEQGMDTVPATLFGAMLVSLLSFLSSKIYKTPIIVYTVSGIIPLVPGGVAYNAMRNFVIKDYSLAIQLSTQVILLAGSIAIGLMFSEVINQIVRKVIVRK
ncbi:threonine/serine exporter family protein [Oceanobacillus senegalensis]|uniref:threonine/serine exporter family protein n=1 Tax=Oceanobacillus senegalensis TaxID=1936063 RepID=UPI000A30B2EF|nr:threonine/serine exporter family protein [Oceanobacillus senegalensis]